MPARFIEHCFRSREIYLTGRSASAATVAVAVVLVAAGCRPAAPPADTAAPAPKLGANVDRSAGAFAQTDPWLLTTTDPDASRGNHSIFLGNGYLGATFGADGTAGREAVSFIAGLYDEQENLKPAPIWHRIPDLPAPDGALYSQTLDLKHGTLSTQANTGNVTAFASAADPHLAAVAFRSTTADADSPLYHPTGATEETMEKLDGADGVRAAVAVLHRHEPGTRNKTRYVAVYTTRDTPDPESAARAAVRKAAATGFDALLTAHTAAWEKRWAVADITIDGDPEAQQLVHKLLFDLLQSARPGSADSIPPESLSGDFYKGHIFWDAEVWMLPALLAQYPELAGSMLEYRYQRLPQARELAKKEGCAGASFPWESAATGREVAPGEFSTERHITADIGWATWQYYLATADKAWLRDRGWPLLSDIADYWATRAKKNPQTGKYEIRGVIGPDELTKNVDNNAFTNAMARYCLLAAGKAAKTLGRPADPRWATVAASLTLPFDKTNNRYLARDADDGKPTKQADGELLLYPANLPMPPAVAQATYTFHAARPIKNGPAMTSSIHALVAARLGRADEAEKAFRASYKPFVRGPFLLFSEKRSLDRCVFTTGAGGVLQSVLYGFGGLDWESWKAPRPVTLPPTWKRLTITGIRRAGKRYTLTVTPQGRSLVPSP